VKAHHGFHDPVVDLALAPLYAQVLHENAEREEQLRRFA
jgi:hypothetical protein